MRVLLIEGILIAIIVILVVWIYFSGGGTLKTRKLKKKIEDLEEQNRILEETNQGLRSGYENSSEKVSRSLERLESLIFDLVRVKEALKGSKSAEETIEEKYGKEISQELIKDIMASVSGVDSLLKEMTVHRILVGSIGKDILKGLDSGKGLDEAIMDSGVPLRIGRERVRLMKDTGYLDSRLNPTTWGYEAMK